MANTLSYAPAALGGLFILGGLLLGLFLLVVPTFATLPGPATREELEEITHHSDAIELMLDLRPLDGRCPTARDMASEGWIPEDWAIDPYGRPYRIDCSGRTPHVFSAGPDRRFDTEDDWPARPLAH